MKMKINAYGKGLLLFLTALLILSGFTSYTAWVGGSALAYADGTSPAIYVNDNFDSHGSGAPAGWSASGLTSGALIAGEEIAGRTGKSLHLRSGTASDLVLTKTFGSSLTGNVAIEMKVKYNNAKFYSPLIQIKSSTNVQSALLEFKADGYMYAGGTKLAGTGYAADTWYQLTVIVKNATKKIDVYVDGVKKISDGSYSNSATINDIASFKSYTKSQTGTANEFWMDDVRVYASDVPLDDSYFQTPDPGTGNANDAYAQARLKQSIAFLEGFPDAYSYLQRKPLSASDPTVKPQAENGQVLIPLQFAAEQLGVPYSWNASAGTVTLGPKSGVLGSAIMLTVGSSNVTGGTNTVVLDAPLRLNGTTLYVSPDLFSKSMGQHVLTHDDLVLVSTTNPLPDSSELSKLTKEAIRRIVYDRPSAAEIIADLKQQNPNQQHPRLFVTPDRIAALQAQIQTDSNLSKWYSDLRKSADTVLTTPVGIYDLPDGRRMDSAKDARPFIEKTALMYLLSGETKYAQRAIDEMLKAASIPNWNEQNEFLNTSELTAGMAIGYDWLYNYLTQQQRDLIRTAIRDKGLAKAIAAHNNNAWWVSLSDNEKISNWNAVCNGGIILGALAIGDEEEAVAGEITAKSLRSLEDFILLEFNPDGGWSEGPGYWRYTVEYLVTYMSAMQTALGQTYGHTETPGFYKTAYFINYVLSPQGSFNFGDSNSFKIRAPELFWMAKQLNNADVAGLRLLLMQEAKQAGGVYDLLWYDPSLLNMNVSIPLDQYFRNTELATFRSKWNDTSAKFAGIMGGKGNSSHAHSDVGNFVFEADGVQWAMDLGSDDYNLPNYFDYDNQRFKYYRLMPEGHNTLVINPDGTFEQDQYAFSSIERYESKPKGGLAVVDMTPAYAKNATTAKRGLMFGDNRSTLTVQDEIHTKTPSTVWWFMHTKADIAVAADGKSAILTQNGKRLGVTMSFSGQAPAGATFKVTDAKPLPMSPNPSGQDPNTGIRKLALELTGVQDLNMAIQLTPLAAGENVPGAASYVPLSSWSIADGEIQTLPQLSQITLNGQPLSGFNKNSYSYAVNVPFGTQNYPVVNATSAKAGDQVSVAQDVYSPSPVVITVTDAAYTNRSQQYRVQFNAQSVLTKPANYTQLAVQGVTASSAQEGNGEERAIDGDMNTRWSADNTPWIQLDLGSQKPVSGLGIAFYNGTTRYFNLDIAISQDGQTWEKVQNGVSSGTSSNMEYFGFAQEQARYIRVTGYGNSVNAWNSYSEMAVFSG
ncbi:discoidin domain-containing protein [Paenibacillus sp. UNC451MF]|uniref:discoidin domain-containing protein n=1 Tax=Paenibacillus sp. UNC451MF TaxID=1449063 RepID=UPI00048D2273|nr:discoidin domain-containing protein [Paenibacillus sp. UNC451MF]